MQKPNKIKLLIFTKQWLNTSRNLSTKIRKPLDLKHYCNERPTEHKLLQRIAASELHATKAAISRNLATFFARKTKISQLNIPQSNWYRALTCSVSIALRPFGIREITKIEEFRWYKQRNWENMQPHSGEKCNKKKDFLMPQIFNAAVCKCVHIIWKQYRTLETFFLFLQMVKKKDTKSLY